jgi:probable F420-dependent oxidoreductase
MPRGTEFGSFAAEVESAGFDVLTIPDHLLPSVSPFAGAAAAAAATTRLHAGTLVLNNDLRHPVDVAREAATVANISGGRFELGIGAGHMKSEYDAAGLVFNSGATRVERLSESVQVIQALLAGDPVAVDGSHYQVHADAGVLVGAPGVPVPLLIGGDGTHLLRLGARVADIVGLSGFAHNRDGTRVRVTHFDAEGVEDRITVVRDAAGERFERIELSVLVQVVVHTDKPEVAAAELAPRIGDITPEQVLDSPFVLIGTHEQMAEAIQKRQQRFGISYWTVYDSWRGRASAMPHLTEVIALLRGPRSLVARGSTSTR